MIKNLKVREFLAVFGIIAGLVVIYSLTLHSSDTTVSAASADTSNNVPFALNDQGNAPAAPDFTLTSLDGNQVKLSDAVKRGPVLLDFWATWCGPCKEELPALSRVYDRYKDRGVQIYAVNVDTDAPHLKYFFSKEHPDCPVLVDPGQQVGATYSVDALPSLFLIDKTMHVRSSFEGADPGTETDLPQALDKLLNGA